MFMDAAGKRKTHPGYLRRVGFFKVSKFAFDSLDTHPRDIAVTAKTGAS